MGYLHPKPNCLGRPGDRNFQHFLVLKSGLAHGLICLMSSPLELVILLKNCSNEQVRRKVERAEGQKGKVDE